VRFEKETAAAPAGIWFCTSLGVTRWAGGKLQRWSENDGLASDSCDDLIIHSDGSVWVASHDGPARFDGKSWRPFDGEPASAGEPRRWPRSGREDEARNEDPAPARSLVQVGGTLWAGSPRGVWPLVGAGPILDRRAGLIDDDIVDLTLDRFGRLWVLGHLGLTITDTFPQP
jgi:ligand-binding sensor domain-containing protein